MKKSRVKFLNIFLLLLFIFVCFAAYKIYSIYQKVRELSAIAFAAQGLLSSGMNLDGIEVVSILSERASVISEELNSELKPFFPILNLMENFPKIGPYLANVEPSINLLLNLTNAAVDLSEIGMYFADEITEKPKSNLPIVFSNLIEEKRADIKDAEKYLLLSEEIISEIDFKYLPERVGIYLVPIRDYLLNSHIL